MYLQLLVLFTDVAAAWYHDANTVLVHSVSAHIGVCALTECNNTVFFIWPDDGSMNRTCRRNFQF
jgi:hypothetical protein